jgi:cysteine synthase A
MARPETKIVAAEPENAALLSGNEWSPHKIQGWTPDFIPGVLNKDIADEIVPVADDTSIANTLRLASEEGIFVGVSGGATLTAALAVAENAPDNSTFLVMLPDTGERYLSTPLFAGISEGSDEDTL